MKKITMSLLVCLLSLIIGNTSIINAEGNMYSSGTLYVNGTINNNNISVLFEGGKAFMPLRTIFEALGANVRWESETNNIYVEYNNETYLCERRTVSQYNFITVKNIKYADSKDNKDYIQLNPMSGDGVYYMVNDSTYLAQETGKRLFEAIGCVVEIDTANNIVKIESKKQ